jgi:hypothetical protein
MAFTIGTYLLARFKNKFPGRVVDVANMSIQKALIAPGKEAQFLRAALDLDWSTRVADCRFYTADVSSTLFHHGILLILFRRPKVQR